MPAACNCCRNRKYAEALYILNDYNDRNTVVAHLSMDHNERALELLAAMPKDAVTEYLRAIACSRMGRKTEGREHFSKHAAWTDVWSTAGTSIPKLQNS